MTYKLSICYWNGKQATIPMLGKTQEKALVWFKADALDPRVRQATLTACETGEIIAHHSHPDDWKKVNECYHNGLLYFTEYVNKDRTLGKQVWTDGYTDIYELT